MTRFRAVARRLATPLAATVLASACTGVGATPPSATPTASPAPTADATVPAPEPTATPAGRATKTDVAYESANDVLIPGLLDVYAPPAGGPYPVVVMFHGTPWEVSKEFLAEHAARVAQLGFVVFDADWGHTEGSPADIDVYAYATASNTQAACAVAYARSHAADYGGDPAKVIVFGHSGGSNVGSVVAFGGAQPSGGCLGDGKVGKVAAFVTWEGDYLLAPAEDQLLEADRRVMDALTPWSALASRPDLPVAMLLSEDPGSQVRAPLPAEAVPDYLALRDKDGTLARLVAKTGVFEDEEISVADMMRVFEAALREQGNPVTFDIIPGSTHLDLSDAGWEVFLAAFSKAVDAAGTDAAGG
jgi:acetyl esterase/lipase